MKSSLIVNYTAEIAVKFTEHYGQVITGLVVQIKSIQEKIILIIPQKTISGTIIVKFKHIEPFFHEKAMHFRGRSLG